jgi:hypothetical protein
VGADVEVAPASFEVAADKGKAVALPDIAIGG